MLSILLALILAHTFQSSERPLCWCIKSDAVLCCVAGISYLASGEVFDDSSREFPSDLKEGSSSSHKAAAESCGNLPCQCLSFFFFSFWPLFWFSLHLFFQNCVLMSPLTPQCDVWAFVFKVISNAFFVPLLLFRFLQNETREKWLLARSRRHIQTLRKQLLVITSAPNEIGSSGFLLSCLFKKPFMRSLMENWGWADTRPPLNMLALTVEQGKRGLDEADRLQREGPAVRQGWRSGRPVSHEQRINIKEKISQWETRSKQSDSNDAGVKKHPAAVSRTLSGDLLGNGYSNKILGVGIHAKDGRSRAKSTELDFRETPEHVVHGVSSRKSEPLKKFATPFSATSPGKTSTTQTLASSKFEVDSLPSADPVFSSNGEPIPDILITSQPLPPSAGDQEDNMPAGNFYTSRGFWRKLEGDRLRWENSRSNAGGAQPPPKPQRTFQYCGTSNSTTGAGQWDNRFQLNNNRSNLRSRRVVQPPNFPPPPCPVIKTEGLSRHKKNR